MFKHHSSLQSLYNELEMKESQERLNFLDITRHSHSTMTKVCNGYAIGKIECTCLPITLHQELKNIYMYVQVVKLKHFISCC